MASTANLFVKFPDGTVRYGSYGATADVARPRLFTYLIDARRYEPCLTDWTDWRAGEGEPVDLATDYGNGFQWSGTATPTRLTSGNEPFEDDLCIDGLPDWAKQ